MKICCVSDTHLAEPELKEGDLLLFAGDATYLGREREWESFHKWFNKERKKFNASFWIAGNHDYNVHDNMPDEAKIGYLEDSAGKYENIHIWGSPYTPVFGNWEFMKFPLQLRAHWERTIPEGIDILMTHGPPRQYGDLTMSGVRAGCPALLEKVLDVSPKLHVFGHIHEGYGVMKFHEITFINASIMDVRYNPINKPVYIDMEFAK